jgi:hypothetical protein
MEGARSLFGFDLREFDEIGDRGGIAEAVAGLSAVSGAEADAISAARLAGAAEAPSPVPGSRRCRSSRPSPTGSDEKLETE